MAKMILTRSFKFGTLQQEFYALKRNLRRAHSDAERDEILRSMSKVWLEAQSLIHTPRVRPQKLTVSSDAARFFLE